MPCIDILAPAAFAPVLTALGRAFDDQGAGTVRFVLGPAAGDAPGAIINRVAQPEGAQGVLLPMALLAQADDAGHLRAGSVRRVFVTSIAAAVPAGARTPDLSTLDALDRHLRSTGRIGLSTAGSGQFLRGRLFPGLPHADEIAARVEAIGGSVGEAVRDGRVSIGFQQYSELVEVEGLQVITTIAQEARNASTVGFAILADAPEAQAVAGFADFLASPAATDLMAGYGLDPAS